MKSYSPSKAEANFFSKKDSDLETETTLKSYLSEAILEGSDDSSGSNIEVRDEENNILFKTRVSVSSVEGGRTIRDVSYSGNHEYISIKGFSVGGGITDWELLDTKSGLRIFPTAYSSESKDWIELIPLLNRQDYFYGMHFYGLEAVGWSSDGKALILASEGTSNDSYSGPYKHLWMKGAYQVTPNDNDPRDTFWLPLQFCQTPVPSWFLDSIEPVIGLRAEQSGRMVTSPINSNQKQSLQLTATKHKNSEYGKWLELFTSTK